MARAVIPDMNPREAHNTLKNTDWYVIRQMEIGKPIPPKVKTLRERARAALSLSRDGKPGN